MGFDEEQYVTRMMCIKCDCGTKINYLNAPQDHGIRMVEGEPLLNANDHEPGENKNIVHFGRCKSMNNPGNILANAAIASTSIVPGAMFLGTKLTELTGLCKCNPKTFTPWENVSEDHIIEGAPALTTKSKLTCFYGGIIEITSEDVE